MSFKISDFNDRIQKQIRAQLGCVVDSGPGEVAKPIERHQGQDCQLESAAQSVGCCLTLIQFRHRLLDAHDNTPFACKATVDALTEKLGLKSDDDKRLRWQYGQHKTRGQEGLLIVMEEFKL